MKPEHESANRGDLQTTYAGRSTTETPESIALHFASSATDFRGVSIIRIRSRPIFPVSFLSAIVVLRPYP